MDLQPFFEAEFAIQVHVVAALFAFFSGLALFFLMRKGTARHKRLGKAWVVAMVIVALSSFFIHELRQWGSFSVVHLISVFALGLLVYAIVKVRQGDIDAHRFTMMGLFLGGLVLAGALTFARGLFMHRIVFPNGSGDFLPSMRELPFSIPVTVLLMAALAFVLVSLYATFEQRRR